MFNIFKRDKPVDRKENQTASDMPSVAPDPEEISAPLNPEETTLQDPSTPPSDLSSAPAETDAPILSDIAAESSPPAVEVTPDLADTEFPPSALENMPEKAGTEYFPPAAANKADEAVSQGAGIPKEPPVPRKSVFYHLLSPETRLGRIMRPVLRWLAAITGLFALGLLAGYILIYQPTQRELDSALAKLATTNQLVSQKAQGLESAQTGLDQAQLTLSQVQDKLTAAASENTLLIVMVDVSSARVALVEKDGAAAKAAITQAQTNLNLALPYIESQDKVLSDLLMSRLDLIAKELVSDPQAAQNDLGKLASDLASLRQKIFGE